jgi:hypothetical protein
VLLLRLIENHKNSITLTLDFKDIIKNKRWHKNHLSSLLCQKPAPKISKTKAKVLFHRNCNGKPTVSFRDLDLR